MVRPKKTSGELKYRKSVTSESDSVTMGNNIELEIFPHPIPSEFLISVMKYFKLVTNMERCVIYYASPADDTIQSGYYEVVHIDKDRTLIFTSIYGEYSVATSDCYLTQELLYAYKHGITLQFKQAELLDSSDIIQELHAEAWNQMLISRDDLL